MKAVFILCCLNQRGTWKESGSWIGFYFWIPEVLVSQRLDFSGKPAGRRPLSPGFGHPWSRRSWHCRTTGDGLFTKPVLFSSRRHLSTVSSQPITLSGVWCLRIISIGTIVSLSKTLNPQTFESRWMLKMIEMIILVFQPIERLFPWISHKVLVNSASKDSNCFIIHQSHLHGQTGLPRHCFPAGFPHHFLFGLNHFADQPLLGLINKPAAGKSKRRVLKEWNS